MGANFKVHGFDTLPKDRFIHNNLTVLGSSALIVAISPFNQRFAAAQASRTGPISQSLRVTHVFDASLSS